MTPGQAGTSRTQIEGQAEILRDKYRPTESVDAYDICLQGPSKFTAWQSASTAEALRLFNSAIEIDPDLALAYSHASRCYAHAKANGWLSDTAHEIAEASGLAWRALELGRDDAWVLCGERMVVGILLFRDLGIGISPIDRASCSNPIWPSGGVAVAG